MELARFAKTVIPYPGTSVIVRAIANSVKQISRLEERLSLWGTMPKVKRFSRESESEVAPVGAIPSRRGLIVSVSSINPRVFAAKRVLFGQRERTRVHACLVAHAHTLSEGLSEYTADL